MPVLTPMACINCRALNHTISSSNGRADLVLEAVFEETGNYAAQPALKEDKRCRVVLEEFLINVFEHLNKDRDTLCSIIAAAQKDVTFNASFHKSFVLPREKMITALLHRAPDMRAHRAPSSAQRDKTDMRYGCANGRNRLLLIE
ncbi:hypothetical protein [Celeribacter halophilus]|uniref:Uncharacterized protein n=2 Tax=Celeribacter halophilus TaxID=576117 RepID=A0A1I3QD16_9RHOB|nr:hypothetical protein [Celeribacter halophilus]PZX14154.1 hypothetical protein LX82_00956 [Celeribacter halophilus]SFJ31469.1 hypothetical protein SAMN04488138_103304 [Celeribacter halophilus]